MMRAHLWFLIICLIGSQSFGLAHLVVHAAAPSPQHEQHAQDDSLCVICDLALQATQILGHAPLSIDSLPALLVAVIEHTQRPVIFPVLHFYTPRGPPSLFS